MYRLLSHSSKQSNKYRTNATKKIHFKFTCSTSTTHYAAKCGLLFEASRPAQAISPNMSTCEACSLIFHLLLTNGRRVLSLQLPSVNLAYVTKTQEHQL